MALTNSFSFFFFSWSSLPKIPDPLAQAMRWINKFPSPIYPKCFSNCSFYTHLYWSVYCPVSLRMKTQFTIAPRLSPNPSCLFLKFQELSHMIVRTHKLIPLWFSKLSVMRIYLPCMGSPWLGCLVWGSAPFLYLHNGVSSCRPI